MGTPIFRHFLDEVIPLSLLLLEVLNGRSRRCVQTLQVMTRTPRHEPHIAAKSTAHHQKSQRQKRHLPLQCADL